MIHPKHISTIMFRRIKIRWNLVYIYTFFSKAINKKMWMITKLHFPRINDGLYYATSFAIKIGLDSGIVFYYKSIWLFVMPI